MLSFVIKISLVERCNPSSSSLLFPMKGCEKSSDGECVRVVEVGTRRLTNDEEANEDDGNVKAADMLCSRTVAHAATDRTSLRMRPTSVCDTVLREHVVRGRGGREAPILMGNRRFFLRTHIYFFEAASDATIIICQGSTLHKTSPLNHHGAVNSQGIQCPRR